VTQKVKRMPTDPSRVRRTDAGDPDKCPVWQLHQVYSDEACKAWVQKGCRSAGHRLPGMQAAGDRRHPARAGADARARADPTSMNPGAGARDHCRRQRKARHLARETMRDVRQAMGLDYPAEAWR
jgi:tryptophanyl-tRNA synthetase